MASFGDLLVYPLRSGLTVPAATRGVGIKMLNMGELFAYPRIPAVKMARVTVSMDDEERVLLQPGDLMFARRSLTWEGAGKCSIVLEVDEPTTWESSIIRARLNREIAVPEYYFYYFRSPQGRRKIETIIEQVAAAGIRSSELRALHVPVPSLKEQRGIAEVLGALDDKIAANNKVAAKATELARTIFVASVMDTPEAMMASILTPVLGGTPSRHDTSLWGGSVPWASAKDIAAAASGVVLSTTETITESATRVSRTRALPVGSVVITARGTVGAVARLGIPSAINQSCYGFRPGHIPPGCLYFVVEAAATQAESLAHGSVFDTITMKTFESVYVPDLSSTDWAAIENVISPLLSRAQQAVSETGKLAETRDELLPLLMAGRVRVKDAEKVVGEVV